MTRTLRTIAVFCGSNLGATDAYARGAETLGRTLAGAGITLVYGGSNRGLMKVLADSVLSQDGQVHGVITEGLHARGQFHPGLTRHEIVPALSVRKARMIELADAFIALPGGIGTVEELMVVWSMNQLGEMNKPLGLLNIADFFSPFLEFLDSMVETQFLPPAHRQTISVDPDSAALLEKLRTHEATSAPKWL
ncbi:MAG: TIGR00730 family Rossman fold protein [Castellaniella sp.]|uniref:LOG family protein n=1 Tax=Castellaniella sp. TaxID=1955812 RepID=UPI0011FD5E6B|nr:TIGR00730 family Rossman fold protein [Castellaniella sp.]TAN29288.1 MAG: TIGR00730 family Rossman fold protein [Castellaniella sp.]